VEFHFPSDKRGNGTRPTTSLNSTNACRHFFAIGKGHTDTTFCDGSFSNPIRELKAFSQLAYSNYSLLYMLRVATITTRNSKHPNLYSVPYPSSLHFQSSKVVPYVPERRTRKVLMSFIGKENHGDTRVRQRIHKVCKKYYREEFQGRLHSIISILPCASRRYTWAEITG